MTKLEYIQGRTRKAQFAAISVFVPVLAVFLWCELRNVALDRPIEIGLQVCMGACALFAFLISWRWIRCPDCGAPAVFAVHLPTVRKCAKCGADWTGKMEGAGYVHGAPRTSGSQKGTKRNQ